MPFVVELGKAILKSPDLTNKQSKELWEKFVDDAYENFKLTKKFRNLAPLEQERLSQDKKEGKMDTFSEFRGKA